MHVNGPHMAAWTSEAFLAEVHAWVSAVAADAGISLTGERAQPHLRPWSSVLRYGAEHGDLWFKVNGTGTRHEAALVATLADLEPSLAPPVLRQTPHEAGPSPATRVRSCAPEVRPRSSGAPGR
jgi:hypothetical protein